MREALDRDPTSGDLFLFVSRNRIRAKVLLWDGTGLCVFAKRLEQGRFAALWKRTKGLQVELTPAELGLLLDGCSMVGRRRLSPPQVDPKRLLISGFDGRFSPCSTSAKRRTSRS